MPHIILDPIGNPLTVNTTKPKKVPPTEIEFRLIGRAVKRGNFDHPCYHNWDDSISILGDLLCFWYNDKTGSTHLIAEKVNN